MKIIHTSDWHLGKKLNRCSRIDEQKKFLLWLSDYIVNHSIDILLVSGDIFDVPNPPNDALKIYFDFLKDVSERSQVHIFIIGGNHDSSKFLLAPSPFLEKSNIYISGNLENLLNDDIDHYVKELEINGEKVSISLFPYFRTHELFNLAKKWEINIEQGALPIIDKIIEKLTPKTSSKKILMSHHLFGSYEEAGSELGLNLSGVESIPTNLLKDFDYVALGHIHKAQTISKTSPIIHYSGSPMAFRFSETTTKTFSELEIKNNTLSYDLIEIEQFDELVRVNCSKDEIELKTEELINKANKSKVIYAEYKIKTDTAITGIAESLREKLKNNGITLLSFQTIIQQDTQAEEEHFLEKSLTTEDLFEMYYKKKFPESKELPEELNQDFKNLLAQVRESNETSVN